jgi:hypothetical protein
MTPEEWVEFKAPVAFFIFSFESYIPKILHVSRQKMKCTVNKQRNMGRLTVKIV